MDRDSDAQTDSRTGPATAPDRVLDDLESYWRDLRGARRLPVRTDVNPAQIDAALPHSFILERMAPGVGRLRVAGQHLTCWLGMEARGMPLSVFFSPTARDVLAQHLNHVFDLPALVELPLTASRGLLRPAATGRILLLPLLSADGTVSRALGAIVTDGPALTPGRRFDIAKDRVMRCEPVDMVARPRIAPVRGPDRAPDRAPDLAPDPGRAMPGPAPHATHARLPHLRLVVSNA